MSAETTNSIPENLKHAIELAQLTKKLTPCDIAQIASGLSGNFATDPIVPLMIACSEDAEEGAVDIFLGAFTGQTVTNLRNVATLCEQGGFARFGSDMDQQGQEARRFRKKELRSEREDDDASGESPLQQKAKASQ